MEGVLRVHAGHLGDLGCDEEGVAHLLPDAVGAVRAGAGFQSLPQLPNLLLQLVQGAEGAGPVEAGLGGLALDLLRPPQGAVDRWPFSLRLRASQFTSTCSEVSACMVPPKTWG